MSRTTTTNDNDGESADYAEESGPSQLNYSEDDWANFQQTLPRGHDSILVSTEGHVMTFTVPSVTTKEQCLAWLDEFSTLTKTTWRVRGMTNTNPRHPAIYRIQRRCHHNTYPRSETADHRKASKNTGCPMWLKLIVNKTFKDRPAHLRVEVHYRHNHQVDTESALSKRDVSRETTNKLLKHFSNGHGAAAARNLLMFDLQQSLSETEYRAALVDRSIIPDVTYVNKLFTATARAKYGPRDKSFDDMCDNVRKKLDTLVSQHGVIGEMRVMEAELLAVIITPVMQRAHTLRESGEVVFLDSTGNLHRNKCKVFLLMTSTQWGDGVPLGAWISTSEKSDSISTALSLINHLMGDGAFNCRGTAGPQCVMTDDNDAIRSAVSSVWPDCSRLLCTYHLGQVAWRWIRLSKNGIGERLRHERMAQIMGLIFSPSLAELAKSYWELQCLEEKFVEYVNELMTRQKEWAHVHRHDSLSQRYTNRVVHAALRILKENILGRARPYNLGHLVEFLGRRLDAYYSRRFLDAAYDRLCRDLPAALSGTVSKVGGCTYTVEDDLGEIQHHINVLVQFCACDKADRCSLIAPVIMVHDFEAASRISGLDRAQLVWLSTGDTISRELPAPVESGDLELMPSSPCDSPSASPFHEETADLSDHSIRVEAFIDALGQKLLSLPPSEELMEAMSHFTQQLENVTTTSDMVNLLHSAASVQLESTPSESAQPAPIQSEPIQPEPIQPEPIQSEPIQPEPIQSEPIQPKPQSNQPESNQPQSTVVSPVNGVTMETEVIACSDENFTQPAKQAKLTEPYTLWIITN